MAVWLSLDIKDNGPIAGTNSSSATVTLTVHYSGGSYNGFNPPGTLTIDGDDYPFTCSFNYAGIGQGNVGQSGSVVACTETVTVPHDSDGTKTLYCSASFDSGTDSGTVTTSASKTLSATSGGGDSGEEPEEPEEPEESDCYWHLNYEIDERLKIGISSVYAARKDNPVTGVGSKTWHTDAHRYTHLWPYFADDDDVGNYDLIVSVVDANGDEIPPLVYSTGEVYYRIDGKRNTPAEYTVKASVLHNSVTHIDDGAEMVLYSRHIDNADGWDTYAPYVDNGVGWDLISE